MWILTIILLLANGDHWTLTFNAGPSLTNGECMAAAADAMELNKVGMHVISATCERAKEA